MTMAGDWNRVLREILTDADGSGLRTVEEYQRRYPEHAEAIAAELGDAPAAAGVERTFGPYHLLRLLGSGGQGEVHLAFDPRLGRRVALKVLTGMASWSTRALERFDREAQVTARLEHPGICTLFESGVHEGTHFIAMRYVEGTSLAEHVQRSIDEGETTVERCTCSASEVPST